MKLFAPHLTDGYKLSHATQYVAGTESVSSNFTPRDFSYAPSTVETVTNKMVFVGLQYAMIEFLIDGWNNSFFNQPKELVLKKFARRIKGYLGSNAAKEAQAMMAALHDLGYLPIRIKALPEGSRVNTGIPVFTFSNTKPDTFAEHQFAALVNYLETILSNTVWPICNSASLMEQYYLLAKKYGAETGASAEFWLPFAMHNFALRGHRGIEDGIMSAFGHSLFHKGTDSFAVIDFAEDYYGANSDEEMIGVSVNASEHATVCQRIAVNGGGSEGERKALQQFLTDVYPTGVFSYVSDSRDFWDVIGNIIPSLKDIILARGPNADGQPGVLTVRPDSSTDTPYEVLLGYKTYKTDTLQGYGVYEEFEDGNYTAVEYDGKFYKAETEYDMYYDCQENQRIALGRELNEVEAKGVLKSLWETFAGEAVLGSDGKLYMLLDSHIRIIYGEAISLQMAHKIYKGMKEAGWSVGNVLFGVGSWAFIGNSSRDTYGVACKATNSVVDGVDYALQKDPKGTSSFKKSARGRLRVEKEGDDYVLYDNQTQEQEEQGELKEVFLNSKLTRPVTYGEIVERLK